MRTLRLAMVLIFLVSLMAVAGPAFADHDHQLANPGGCATIPVAHQAHGEADPGRKFHGAAHKGAATAEVDGAWVLGRGNSVVTVDGGACS